MTVCKTAASSSPEPIAAFLRRLLAQRRLAGDEPTARFFLAFTELAVAKAARGTGSSGYQAPLDALARLVVLLVRAQEPDSPAAVAGLLAGVLAVIVRVLYAAHDHATLTLTRTRLLQDAASAALNGDTSFAASLAEQVGVAAAAGDDAVPVAARFNPRIYHRLLVTLLAELSGPDSSAPTAQVDALALPTLAAFGNTLLALRPLRVPPFAFAWVELCAHRAFMPRLLLAPNRKGWPLFQRLMLELLAFLEPHLARARLSPPIRRLYDGTLRMLLVSCF
jgi:CCR4-NOT transcription complex subunit 1